MRLNKLLVADTQHQVAASRRLLHAGQRQRYAADYARKVGVKVRTMFVVGMSILVGQIVGCAAMDAKTAQRLPNEIVLMDAPKDAALIYLLRAPHDPKEIVILVDGVPATRLRAATYTALELPAGKYRLGSRELEAKQENGTPFELVVMEGERRFFYMSTPLPNPVHLSAAGAVFRGAVGVAITAATAAFAAGNQQPNNFGQRVWKECNELDARGLASISIPVNAALR
jgi:hypothetical protein